MNVPLRVSRGRDKAEPSVGVLHFQATLFRPLADSE